MIEPDEFCRLWRHSDIKKTRLWTVRNSVRDESNVIGPSEMAIWSSRRSSSRTSWKRSWPHKNLLISFQKSILKIEFWTENFLSIWIASRTFSQRERERERERVSNNRSANAFKRKAFIGFDYEIDLNSKLVFLNSKVSKQSKSFSVSKALSKGTTFSAETSRP